MTVYRRQDIANHWPEDAIFEYIKAQQGEIFRYKEGRRTLQFSLANKPYFLKYHEGVGWGEIIKNLCQLRLPIISAKSEWQAIQFLEAQGLDTLSIAAYGERGWNPAKKTSFLVTEELTHTMSLEHLGAQWRKTPPTFKTKQILIEKLANIAKVMHENGINHRDFYLCHFLLDDAFAEQNTITKNTPLHLIDLHRAQIRKQTPRRWQVKDLGSLYYSAMNVPHTQRDLLRFMVAYTGLSARDTTLMPLWKDVTTKARQLQQSSGHDMAELIPISPIEAFLKGERQLMLPFDLRQGKAVFTLTDTLRLLPAKRAVFAAETVEWGSVVIKLFALDQKGQRELAREQRGHQLATAAGVNVAPLLASYEAVDACAAIVYGFLAHAKPLKIKKSLHWSKRQKIEQLFEMIAKLHQYGIYQEDIHLDNILRQGKKLYLVDLATVRGERVGEPLSKQKSLENIALLIAQFKPKKQSKLVAGLADYYQARGWYLNAAEKAASKTVLQAIWQKRERKFLDKQFRETTATVYHKSASLEYAFGRGFWDGLPSGFVGQIDDYISNGVLLKDGHSATVVQTEIVGKPVVIKRYNIKGKGHFLRRCWRRSRAAVSWRNAHLLRFIGVRTPKPLGFIERRAGFLRTTAYFISQYKPAKEMHNVYEKRQPRPKEIKQLKQIFSLLDAELISHGDLKASNLLIDRKGEVFLIDLDGMKSHGTQKSYEPYSGRDWQRFMENWQEDDLLSELFRKRIRKQ